MLNVAAYCRVSTDKDDQANSFESQKLYFEEYIKRNPEWELYEIYADVYNQKLIPFDTKMAAKMIKITAFEGKNACPKPLFLFFEIV